MKSLFVFDPQDVSSSVSGGVQLCSQEFLKIIRLASDSLDYQEVSITRRLLWRLRRRLKLGSYLLYHPEEARVELSKKAHNERYTHIFINRPELLLLAPLLKELFPESQVILMSFGNQSGDDLYELAGKGGRRNKGLSRLIARWQIGQDIGVESWFRHRYIDAVCAMSKEEEVIERWLGAKNTVVLPRLIDVNPLTWQPKPRRVGFVGTLNHTPNSVALKSICEELSNRQRKEGIELRVVGRPEALGYELAKKYKFVSYLGSLNDSELKEEVSTWNLFFNPVFWLSCGASMKLGQAISWGIPFLTTRSGARGYELVDADFLTTSDNVCDFVTRLFEIIDDPASLEAAIEIVRQNQISSPTVENLSDRLSSALGNKKICSSDSLIATASSQ